MERPTALVLVPHFFAPGNSSAFKGGSTVSSAGVSRPTIVASSYESIAKSFSHAGIEAHVQTVGMTDCAALPIDIDASEDINDPRHIPFFAAQKLRLSRRDYDYFALVEDDILLPVDLITRLNVLNAAIAPSCLLLPNRIESIYGSLVCPDQINHLGTLSKPRNLAGTVVARTRARHSGMLFFDRQRFDFATRSADLVPHLSIGGYMASALNSLTQPFDLLREVPYWGEVSCVHLDSWIQRFMRDESSPVRRRLMIKWLFSLEEQARIARSHWSKQDSRHLRVQLSAAMRNLWSPSSD